MATLDASPVTCTRPDVLVPVHLRVVLDMGVIEPWLKQTRHLESCLVAMCKSRPYCSKLSARLLTSRKRLLRCKRSMKRKRKLLSLHSRHAFQCQQLSS
jgi:hypothetical protein